MLQYLKSHQHYTGLVCKDHTSKAGKMRVFLWADLRDLCMARERESYVERGDRKILLPLGLLGVNTILWGLHWGYIPLPLLHCYIYQRGSGTERVGWKRGVRKRERRGERKRDGAERESREKRRGERKGGGRREAGAEGEIDREKTLWTELSGATEGKRSRDRVKQLKGELEEGERLSELKACKTNKVREGEREDRSAHQIIFQFNGLWRNRTEDNILLFSGHTADQRAAASSLQTLSSLLLIMFSRCNLLGP